MKILVTGASGFIGSHLVVRLLERGHQLSVLTRSPHSLAQFPWSASVKVIQGSLDDPAALAAACVDQNLLVHCAGFAHSAAGNSDYHDRINYRGTANLLEAALKENVGRFIYLSSSKVNSSVKSAYSEAKRKAENLLMAAHQGEKIQACCLRPAAVYGTGMKGNLLAWIRAIAESRAPVLPAVQTRLALISVSDLCTAIVMAAGSSGVWGKCLVVSDGVAYQVKEIETAIRQGCGKSPGRIAIPKAGFWLAAQLAEGLKKISARPPGFGRSSYNTLFVDEYLDGNEFSRLTGFVAQDNFYAALPSLLQEARTL